MHKFSQLRSQKRTTLTLRKMRDTMVVVNTDNEGSLLSNPPFSLLVNISSFFESENKIVRAEGTSVRALREKENFFWVNKNTRVLHGLSQTTKLPLRSNGQRNQGPWPPPPQQKAPCIAARSCTWCVTVPAHYVFLCCRCFTRSIFVAKFWTSVSSCNKSFRRQPKNPNIPQHKHPPQTGTFSKFAHHRSFAGCDILRCFESKPVSPPRLKSVTTGSPWSRVLDPLHGDAP